MSFLQVVVCGVAVCIVATLLWASLRYFRQSESENPQKRWYKYLIYSVIVLHVVCITFSNPPASSILCLGVALALFSLALFWAAVRAHGVRRPAYAFDHLRPESFVLSGPYRLVRHPFYLSFMLLALASTMMAGQPLLLLTVMVLAIVYVRVATHEENSLLVSEFGDHYKQYRQATGMFVPCFRRRINLESQRKSDQDRSQSPS